MNRIAIIGCSGSGKSRLARDLGGLLGIPVTHLDVLYWQPGWRPHPDPRAFRESVADVVACDRWIIDGGFLNDAGADRVTRADLIILFDLPTWLCLWRIHKRLVLWFGRSRPDLAQGCPERFDAEFPGYVLTYRRKVLPGIEALVAPFRDRLVRIRSERDRANLMMRLGSRAPGFITR